MPRKQVSKKEIVVSTPVPTVRKAVSTRAKRPAAAPVAATAPAAATALATQVAPAAPSRDAIAALAYSYWEGRGCQGGSPDEDWARAEAELSARRPLATAAIA